MRSQNRQQEKFEATLAGRAQYMRKNPTDTEAALWRELSGKKLGIAFKRQAVIGRYVVDFVAPSIRLIVEVDGGYHAERVAGDARRTRDLERLEYRVVRLAAQLVRCNIRQAVELVKEAV